MIDTGIILWNCLLYDYGSKNRVTESDPIKFIEILVSLPLPTCVYITKVEIRNVWQTTFEESPYRAKPLLAVNDKQLLSFSFAV